MEMKPAGDKTGAAALQNCHEGPILAVRDPFCAAQLRPLVHHRVVAAVGSGLCKSGFRPDKVRTALTGYGTR